MFIFKLSWLPYIFILGGIWGAIEGDPSSLLLSVIGGVWLAFKYANKSDLSSQTSTSSQTRTSSTNTYSATNEIDAEPVTPALQPSAAPVKPVDKVCRYCGANVEPDDIYCVECGEKL